MHYKSLYEVHPGEPQGYGLESRQPAELSRFKALLLATVYKDLVNCRMNISKFRLETVLTILTILSLLLALLLTSLLLFPERNASGSEAAQNQIRVFFPNSRLKTGTYDCTDVYPVERWIDPAAYPPLEALGELLSGPTEEEEKESYNTNINSSVAIRGFWVEEGLVKVDFTSKIEEGGGSCWVRGIVSQIKNTLKQFDDIEQVKIFVNGSSEGVLQP